MLFLKRKVIDVIPFLKKTIEDENKKDMMIEEYYGKIFGYSDYDDIDWRCYQKEAKTKHKKQNKKKKKHNVEDEDFLMFFYPDMTDKTNRNEFSTLFEFDEFLTNTKYDIDEDTIMLMYRHLNSVNALHSTMIQIPFYDDKVKQTVYKDKLIVAENWSSLVFKCDNELKQYEDE